MLFLSWLVVSVVGLAWIVFLPTWCCIREISPIHSEADVKDTSMSNCYLDIRMCCGAVPRPCQSPNAVVHTILY